MKKYLKDNLQLVLSVLWILAMTYFYITSSYSYNITNKLALVESDCLKITANYEWITGSDCIEQMFAVRKTFIFMLFIGLVVIAAIFKFMPVFSKHIVNWLNGLNKKRRVFLVATFLLMPVSIILHNRNTGLDEVETLYIFALTVQVFLIALAFTNLSDWIDKKE